MAQKPYDFSKRLKDKSRASRTAAQARALADEFREPEGIDIHMMAVVDELLGAPPAKKFSWLSKDETLAFADQLWPHQKQAVMLTVRNKKTGVYTLNASDVGTGKTRVAAAAAQTLNFKKVLWLTSKNLVKPTVEEIMRVGGMAIAIGDQSKLWTSMPFGAQYDTIFYVTNYQCVYRDHYMTTAGSIGPEWDCIIIDECTVLKGGASYSPTKIWKATKELCNAKFPKAYKMFLSATPAENAPEEIWAYLNIFDPERFKSFGDFKKLFCLVDRVTGKPYFKADMLLELLGGMCIRQTVSSIKADFPNFKAADLDDPYWFHAITVPLNVDPDTSVGQKYLSMQDASFAQLDREGHHVLKPKIVLEVMLRLRQLLQAGKTFTYSKTEYYVDTDKIAELEATGDYDPFNPPIKKVKTPRTVDMEPPFTKHDAVEEKILELQSQGEACVVFSCFNQPLINLYNSLTEIPGIFRVGIVTGEHTQLHRDTTIAAFQNGELDVLLLNKLTGGKGLNLQKCDLWEGGARFALHMDRWWNPAVERQANGRFVRSNTLYPVTAYYFEVENSVDVVMRELVESKADNIKALDVGLIIDSINRARLG